jgi:hypothetical protein
VVPTRTPAGMCVQVICTPPPTGESGRVVPCPSGRQCELLVDKDVTRPRPREPGRVRKPVGTALFKDGYSFGKFLVAPRSVTDSRHTHAHFCFPPWRLCAPVRPSSAQLSTAQHEILMHTSLAAVPVMWPVRTPGRRKHPPLSGVSSVVCRCCLLAYPPELFSYPASP